MYAATGDEFFDVENVLLYNVETSHLRHRMGLGVRVERGFTAPEPPIQIESGASSHYIRYSFVAPEADFTHWVVGLDLARFEGVRLKTVSKPDVIWAAVRRQVEPPTPSDHTGIPFGLRVRIAAPGKAHGSERRNPSEIVKPVLDGVVSALHSHDGQQLDDVLPRLAARGAGTPSDLRAMLMDQRWAVLGTRRLVWKFGTSETGVQWNPADHLAQVAQLVLDPEPTSHGEWELSARVFVVEPRRAVDGSSNQSHIERVAVPADDAGEWAIIEFALSYNAYDVFGSDAPAMIAQPASRRWERDGIFPAELDTLRICLFFAQRAHRHFETRLDQDP